MTYRKTEGLIAAPFTPMREDRTLNLDAVEGYARWLHRQGVVGAFICGTTGEGMSLTMDERRQLAERWVTTAPAALRVIVHAGHNGLADCRALAAHAQSIGANSIACLSPFFFKPTGAVGSTYNYAAPVYHALIAAHQQGDSTKSAELQALAVRMINAFLECGAHPIAAFKWFMSQVAVECGPVRLPLVNPTPEQIAALKTKLDASGVFDWVQRRSTASVAVCA